MERRVRLRGVLPVVDVEWLTLEDKASQWRGPQNWGVLELGRPQNLSSLWRSIINPLVGWGVPYFQTNPNSRHKGGAVG